MTTCSSCVDIAEAEAGRHPWGVARLRGGYVWLNPCQYYPGSVFFVAPRCVAELHELPAELRQVHLADMVDVAAAVQREFAARKMNYEALGNSVAHVHWWLTPRPYDDARPRGPIWEDMDFLRNLWTGGARPGRDEADALRRRVLRALAATGLEIERDLVGRDDR
jgi:diadenosine tetraphosphate (Ap4A) HIT family hydrolase